MEVLLAHTTSVQVIGRHGGFRVGASIWAVPPDVRAGPGRRPRAVRGARRQWWPGSPSTARMTAAATEICRRLDGIVGDVLAAAADGPMSPRTCVTVSVTGSGCWRLRCAGSPSDAAADGRMVARPARRRRSQCVDRCSVFADGLTSPAVAVAGVAATGWTSTVLDLLIRW